jgi:hypothetical protein
MWVTLLMRVRRSNGELEFVLPGPGIRYTKDEKLAARFPSDSDPEFLAKKAEIEKANRPVVAGVEPGFECDWKQLEVPD